MRISTWNIGSGININSYKEELFDITPALKPDDNIIDIIANQIIANKIDVIAMQEVITTESFNYVNKLSEKTWLKYHVSYENSPCHLVKNTMFGLAILSRYPIEIIKKQLFPNPRLTVTTTKGIYSTHDKGYIIAKIDADEPFYISCTQFLPFHRFNVDILDYKSLFDEYQINNLMNKTICVGDFNCIDGIDKIEKVLDLLSKEYRPIFNEITTIDGKKCDNILVPKSVSVKKQGILKNDLSSDHYMCFVEI